MQEVPVVKEFKELPKLWRGRRRQVPIKHRKEAIQRALSGLESTRDIAESLAVDGNIPFDGPQVALASAVVLRSMAYMLETSAAEFVVDNPGPYGHIH